MNITIRNSPNQRAGRNGQIPDFIVMHTTGGSFAGALSWTLNPSAQVSYHFIVARDGAITQTVPIENTAWHAGTNNNGGNVDNRHSTIPAVRDRRLNANSYSVGIGFSDLTNHGTPSPQQLETAVWLVRHIRDEIRRLFNFTLPIARSNIVSHDEVTPRNRNGDPGRNFPFDEIIRRANGGSATPAPTPAPTPPTASLQFRVGDIIQFTGGDVFISASATTPAHSRNASRCRVTQTFNGRNPYHLISEDGGGVHGWVSASSVRTINAPAPTPSAPTAATPSPRPSIDEIARQVISGNWGNGAERVRRLTAAGHDAQAVQRRVNELLR